MSRAPPEGAGASGAPQGEPIQNPLEDDVVQPGESVPQPQGDNLKPGAHMKVSHLVLWKVGSMLTQFYTVQTAVRVIAVVAGQNAANGGNVVISSVCVIKIYVY